MEYPSDLRKDLTRLAQFGLNIADAHSCLVVLPAFGGTSPSRPAAQNADSPTLILAGYHSLSTDIIDNTRFSYDSGLIGWVAKHARSIHVSPFENDSRTLGIYSQDQQLKSFIGIPIELAESSQPGQAKTGVIACDSKKSFAFSKLQGKLIEDLAREIANTLRLHSLTSSTTTPQVRWDSFLDGACQLGHSLGLLSLEVMRLRHRNFEVLEEALGTGRAIDLTDQVFRLIQQAMPPHFPHTRLPNGDIVIVLDTMMSSFIENKVRAICQHVAVEEKSVEFEFIKNPARRRKERSVHIERLIIDTAQGLQQQHQVDRGLNYEYRRA